MHMYWIDKGDIVELWEHHSNRCIGVLNKAKLVYQDRYLKSADIRFQKGTDIQKAKTKVFDKVESDYKKTNLLLSKIFD